jgi:simple sugar transport system permease protein
VPAQAFWSLALAVLLWFILNRHKFGESVMFVGDNANVAKVMGVNVEATRIKLFALHGMIAAFSGIIVTLDIGVFYPDQGNFLLPAMASVFVGGTSIAGGAGSIFGTFFGSYVIGSLVVLNAATDKGGLATLLNRLRHWSAPVAGNTASGLLRKDDTARN